MDDSTTKRCPKCGEGKPRNQFPKSKHKPDGYAGHCKACKRVDYLLKRDAYIARVSRYQREHAEQVNAQHRDYRIRNQERMLARERGYRQKHSFRRREVARRRQAWRNGILRENIVDYESIWQRDGGICHICSGLVARDDVHFDHVIPLSKGGPHTYDNIKVSHSTCNWRKGSKLIT